MNKRRVTALVVSKSDRNTCTRHRLGWIHRDVNRPQPIKALNYSSGPCDGLGLSNTNNNTEIEHFNMQEVNILKHRPS